MCQALIKQLRTDVGVTFGPVDIIAEFNSNVIWYFRPGTIGNSQTDFEYVAVHELLHGMGFGSGFFEYSTVFAGAREGYLAPLMIGVKSGEATTATLLSNLEPIDIFDSFIPVLDAAGERISQFPTQSLTYLRFISAFENSGDPFRAAQQAYQSATRPLQFVSGNQNVSLYTPASFEQGSSLSHVTLAQSNQPDFLMIPQLRAGVDMDVLIGSGSLLGPGLRTVMESIGWLTSNSSTVQTVTMATDYGRKPTSSSIKVKPLWMLLLFSIFII